MHTERMTSGSLTPRQYGLKAVFHMCDSIMSMLGLCSAQLPRVSMILTLFTESTCIDHSHAKGCPR